MPRTAYAILTIFAGMISAAAPADDGAFEINALCVAEGCFIGDDPGYPVTLSQAGQAYVMTSSLELGDLNTDVIEITADNISLDMQGFSIRGPVVCEGSPVTNCSPSGTARGIGSTTTAGTQKIRNGFITGIPGDCLEMIPSGITPNTFTALVEDMVVSHCGDDGILVAAGFVRNVTASYVLDAGILMTRGLLQGAYVTNAGDRGISADRCTDVYAQIAPTPLNCVAPP